MGRRGWEWEGREWERGGKLKMKALKRKRVGSEGRDAENVTRDSASCPTPCPPIS